MDCQVIKLNFYPHLAPRHRLVNNDITTSASAYDRQDKKQGAPAEFFTTFFKPFLTVKHHPAPGANPFQHPIMATGCHALADEARTVFFSQQEAGPLAKDFT